MKKFDLVELSIPFKEVYEDFLVLYFTDSPLLIKKLTQFPEYVGTQWWKFNDGPLNLYGRVVDFLPNGNIVVSIFNSLEEMHQSYLAGTDINKKFEDFIRTKSFEVDPKKAKIVSTLEKHPYYYESHTFSSRHQAPKLHEFLKKHKKEVYLCELLGLLSNSDGKYHVEIGNYEFEKDYNWVTSTNIRDFSYNLYPESQITVEDIINNIPIDELVEDKGSKYWSEIIFEYCYEKCNDNHIDAETYYNKLIDEGYNNKEVLEIIEHELTTDNTTDWKYAKYFTKDDSEFDNHYFVLCPAEPYFNYYGEITDDNFGYEIINWLQNAISKLKK